MSSPRGQQSQPDDLNLNSDNLYLEEAFTDLEVGSIRRLTPVKADGTLDPTRPLKFIGQTQLMTRAGPLPIEMPIEAASLKEACDKFGQAIEDTMQRIAAQIERHQIEQARQIVVPSTGLGGLGNLPGAGPARGGPGDLIIR